MRRLRCRLKSPAGIFMPLEDQCRTTCRARRRASTSHVMRRRHGDPGWVTTVTTTTVRTDHAATLRPRGRDRAGSRAHAPAATSPPMAGTAETQVEYTCPMHPQVRQMGPGSCPICGMALEPVLATAQTGDSPELRDMTRRFWIGLGADRTRLCARDGRAPGGPASPDRASRPRTGCSCCSARRSCCGRAGRSSSERWASLKNRSLNMFTLIALGTGAAWLYSIVGTVAPAALPARSFARLDGAVADLLRGCGRHHGPGAARPGARAARAREDLRRHPGAARPGAEDGRAGDALTARTNPCEIDTIQVGELPARASRREGAGGRRADRRQGHRRRIDGDRRADAGGQGAGLQGHRGHAEPDRRLRHARREGRRRHPALADRPHGRGGPAQPRADPAHGRPGGRLVRAGGDRRGAS